MLDDLLVPFWKLHTCTLRIAFLAWQAFEVIEGSLYSQLVCEAGEQMPHTNFPEALAENSFLPTQAPPRPEGWENRPQDPSQPDVKEIESAVIGNPKVVGCRGGSRNVEVSILKCPFLNFQVSIFLFR